MTDVKIMTINEEFRNISTKFEAYAGTEPYLFVSYSHIDVEKVYPILDALHDKKFRLWYDESCENGNDFRDELRHRIEHAEAILLFVSKNSMSSPYCGMEIIVARENNKRIYPIYLDEEPLPPAFQLLLINTHHSTAENLSKLVKNMVRDLPAEAMDRLTQNADTVEKCEDNGDLIEVGEGIKFIADAAFKDRVQLHHIVLPSTLEMIGVEAFRGCRHLEEINIPNDTKRIQGSAFRDCVNMKSLIVKNNTIKIGERAFENCSSLENISLPDGLREIYGGVFNSCRSLVDIKLPKNLNVLGESAFADCVGLKTMSIPDGVTKIDDLVFSGCTNLEKIDLPEALRKIGKGAFKNCSALKSISLPVNLSSIGEAPFRGCESLKTIRVEPKNKYYKSSPIKQENSDHVLFNKNKSILIAYPAASREVQYDVPDSVVCISDWAFSECKKLNRIDIPDSVREIGEGAFSNCILLDEVSIPDSVEKLDDCVFAGCQSLEKVVIPDSVKELGWGLFDGCENTVVVYCEEDSEIYKYCINNDIEIRDIHEKDL